MTIRKFSQKSTKIASEDARGDSNLPDSRDDHDEVWFDHGQHQAAKQRDYNLFKTEEEARNCHKYPYPYTRFSTPLFPCETTSLLDNISLQ